MELPRFLADCTEAEVATLTLETYSAALANHLLPRIGSLKVADVIRGHHPSAEINPVGVIRLWQPAFPGLPPGKAVRRPAVSGKHGFWGLAGSA